MSERIDMWRAPDGKTFSSDEACLEYERQRADAEAANELLEGGANLFDVLARANRSRPWWDKHMADDNHAMLKRMTKDSGLVVKHWQCRETPGYKFCRVNHDGLIHLFGDAGSWSGSYGNWVRLDDFIGYARGTPGLLQPAAEKAQ